LGKLIGGGSPVGSFGGKADIMALTDPRGSAGLTHAGTFNANPFTMASGLITLRDLAHDKIAAINRRGDDLRDWINESSSERGLPFTATGVGSLVQVHTATTPPTSCRESFQLSSLPLQAMFFLLLEEDVLAAPNRLLMTVSTPMGDAEMDTVKGAFDRAFSAMSVAGLRATPVG
jgi:glutamate-1-semialdehyde 2,1-aminomutase